MERKDRNRFLLFTAINGFISGSVLLIITVLFPHKLWLSFILFSIAFFVGSYIISKAVLKKGKQNPMEQI